MVQIRILEERYDKFKNSSKEIKNTYKQIVQAQKKLNQMKYINKLSGELIDITDKKLAPLINDSFSYTRDFFAYSKQEKKISSHLIILSLWIQRKKKV